jgi:hypothetical protein
MKNFLLRRVSAPILSATAIALLAPAPSWSAGVLIDVAGEKWNIDEVVGTFADNQALLESQPWFGDERKAEIFSSSLNTKPSFTDVNGFNGGLFFAWDTFNSLSEPGFTRNPELGVRAKFWKSIADPCNSDTSGGGVCSVFPDAGTVNGNPANWHYAIATRSQAVPGPLPVFGAAAAFGFSRQLRKRIKGFAKVE